MKAFLETFKPVPGYEGLYEVSDFGTVRSLNYRQTGKKKEMKPGKSKYGYQIVELSRDAVGKTFTVHRIVWEAFNGPIHDGKEIDHINTVRDDNRLVNLRVVTRKENVNNPISRARHLEANRIKNKRMAQCPKWQEANSEAAKRRSQDPKWKESHRMAMRKACAKPVLQLDKETGAVLREWECMRDIERELGMSVGNISECCNGKRNSTGGFKWQFANYNK